MPAYVNFPAWIRPEIIPGFPLLRWYGLMYVVAFGFAYVLFRWQVRDRKLPIHEDDISGFFGAGILGLIVGARLFYVFFYEKSGIFLEKPWLAILPVDERWRFAGFSGLSFHGGFLGALVGCLIYAKRHKLDFLLWADMLVAAIPLGYTFGRFGNFINGELYGKVTAGPFGMLFPNADTFRAGEPWVRSMLAKLGMSVSTGMVNLPRHPSQLYEALFEGVLLWLVLWFLVRPRMPWKGFAVGAYIAGYGLVRFVIEYFREPDAQLGYVLPLADPDANIHFFSSPWNFSMGQALCLLMVVGGALFAFLARKNAYLPAERSGPGLPADAPDPGTRKTGRRR